MRFRRISVTRFERMDEYLESRRMPSQFEQPHYAYDTEELQYIVVLLQVIEQEVEVEAERRNEVDDVHRSENKRALAGTDNKSVHTLGLC